jgi:hypothetical protein
MQKVERGAVTRMPQTRDELKNGVLECWSVGVLECWSGKLRIEVGIELVLGRRVEEDGDWAGKIDLQVI